MELEILELKKKLAILEDCKHKIQNRIDFNKEKLSNIQQNIRAIRRYGEKNFFDSSDIKQEHDETDLNEFLAEAKNKKIIYNRTPISDDIIDSHRDKFSFI